MLESGTKTDRPQFNKGLYDNNSNIGIRQLLQVCLSPQLLYDNNSNIRITNNLFYHLIACLLYNIRILVRIKEELQ